MEIIYTTDNPVNNYKIAYGSICHTLDKQDNTAAVDLELCIEGTLTTLTFKAYKSASLSTEVQEEIRKELLEYLGAPTKLTYIYSTPYKQKKAKPISGELPWEEDVLEKSGDLPWNN